MSFEKDIDHCLQVLKRGGLIVYPTDTIWGIGCDATDPDAVQRIYSLKQRADNKAMIVLVAEERDVMQYVAAVDLQVFDVLQTLPKPTTVIYDGAIGLADNLTLDGSIGIRICKDEFCRHLIKRFRKPIVSTSANISGAPAPATFKEISEEIISGVDYVVQYRQNEESASTPSSVVKWSDGRLIYLRE